eukprot:226618-Prorocentrum_lima.AAC.1
MTSSLVGSEMCIRDSKRGVCMARIPPYQPRSNGLIERMVGIIQDHMRSCLLYTSDAADDM